jgi:hypothetical protein
MLVANKKKHKRFPKETLKERALILKALSGEQGSCENKGLVQTHFALILTIALTKKLEVVMISLQKQ